MPTVTVTIMSSVGLAGDSGVAPPVPGVEGQRSSSTVGRQLGVVARSKMYLRFALKVLESDSGYRRRILVAAHELRGVCHGNAA